MRWVLALLPLGLGLGLRLFYALHAGPFVDEPTTLLVAQAIARSGLPVLPSGLFYGNDLPYAYLAGAVTALLGPNLLALRLLSVAASVATIALVFQAGRRLFSFQTGLWAALLLALAPQEVIWGGRARAYALLGLLALAVVLLFYNGMTTGRAGPRRLGLLLLCVAVFVHPEAVLLLPALVVAAALLKGWRWWLHPGRLTELGLAVAVAAARYWLQLALARGWLSGLATLAGSRPPLQPATDLLQRLAGVAPFFTEPARLPWTVLAVLFFAVAARQWATHRLSPAGRAGLFLSVCLWLPPVLMVLFLGSTYQSPRYLGLLLPIFALVAAAGLDWLLTRVTARLARPGVHRALGALITLALVVVYLPAALAAAGAREKGFRPALEVVRDGWQPGDRVATVAPAFSQLVLGRSDWFALGKDYEEFVYRAPDGHWLDRWVGSPLIRTAGELAVALEAGGRLWLVVDETRFRDRFDPAFAQLAWDRMELVARVDDVLVLRSVEPATPATSQAVDAVWDGQVALAGYDLGAAGSQPAEPGWGEVVARPGERLPLTLRWTAVGPVAADYTALIHLIGADGQRYAQADGPPLNGKLPTTRWLPGEVLTDRRSLDLPAGLPPGRYRIDVGLYDAGGDRLAIATAAGEPLGDALALDSVRVPAAGEQLPVPAQPLDVELANDADRVRLLGYALRPATADDPVDLGLVLYWQTPARLSTDYTVFVHLLDDSGTIRGQGDGRVLGGFYPTTAWDAGEIVADEHWITVEPDTPPGSYRLIVGLYDLASGQRLSVEPGGLDYVDLGRVQVGE